MSNDQPDISVFIDTNCFIHLRDLKDLPWSALFGANQWIELVVSPVVIDELDKFKVDRNKRRRDRSRAALKIVEQASENESFRITLKDNKHKVSMRVYSGDSPDWDNLPKLDRSRADDVLVATAITENKLMSCCLLSYDTGPLIRARAMQLPAYKAPKDWLLPEQKNDDENQEIKQLQKELEAIKATRPRLELEILGKKLDIDFIELYRVKLEPLPRKQCEELRQKILKKFPMKKFKRHDNSHAFLRAMSAYSDISNHQIDEYERKYEKFVSECSRFVNELHEAVRHASITSSFDFRLKNESSITALNVLVEYKISDGAFLVAERDDLGGGFHEVCLPKPPKPPKISSPFNHMPTINQNMWKKDDRNPTGFYWQDRPGSLDRRGSLICNEFRAHEEFTDTVNVMLGGDAHHANSIEFRVSATNLPAPIHLSYPLRFSEKSVDWADNAVFSVMDEELASLVRDIL